MRLVCFVRNDVPILKRSGVVVVQFNEICTKIWTGQVLPGLGHEDDPLASRHWPRGTAHWTRRGGSVVEYASRLGDKVGMTIAGGDDNI